MPCGNNGNTDSTEPCIGGNCLVIGDSAVACLAKAENHSANAGHDGLRFDYVIIGGLTPKDIGSLIEQVNCHSDLQSIYGPVELQYTSIRHFTDRFEYVLFSLTESLESAVIKSNTREFLTDLTSAMLKVKKNTPYFCDSRLHFLSPMLRPTLSLLFWTHGQC